MHTAVNDMREPVKQGISAKPRVEQAFNPKAAFFPYPSFEVCLQKLRKRDQITDACLTQMMITDMLFNAPRLRFSEKQKKAILEWARQLGAKNVPSQYALKKFRELSLKKLGDPTTKRKFDSGNIAYVNEMHVAVERVSPCCLEILFMCISKEFRPMEIPILY